MLITALRLQLGDVISRRWRPAEDDIGSQETQGALQGKPGLARADRDGVRAACHA